MVLRLVIRLVPTDRLSDGLSEGLADGLADGLSDGLPNQVAERARRRHVDGEVLKRRMLDAAPNQTVVVGVQLLGTTWISRYENVRPKTGQVDWWSRRARGTDLQEMNGMSPGRPPGPCVSISRWADLRVAIRNYSRASSYELGPPALRDSYGHYSMVPCSRGARESMQLLFLHYEYIFMDVQTIIDRHLHHSRLVARHRHPN